MFAMMIPLLFFLHVLHIFAEVCSPQDGAAAISKQGCPDLFDAYQCGEKIEEVSYSSNDEKCTGVWHSNWEFEIIDDAMHFHDVKKSPPAKIDGTDIVFEKKYELRRWLEWKPIRELEEALGRMESGELTVKSWREEPELTVEEEVSVMHAVADAFESHGYEEHAVGLRKEATTLSVSRRRNLKFSRITKNGIDFCDTSKSCEAAFKVGLDQVLGLSSSSAQDFCKKHHDKMDYMPLTCCGGNQCLFYCMSNSGDSCAEFWAPKEPIHCCDDYDYNSQSMRCYKEKEVCPPGMTSCSLASIFAPAAYCSRGAGACWEKIGEMIIRVADVAISVGSMIFSAGASAAAKAGIKAGATALAKVTGKAASRAAMKTAMKTAFKAVKKSLRRGVVDHFKGVTQEIIFTHIVEEATMATTAQRAQSEGAISAEDVLGMVDPTGIYELVGFFNSFEDCLYPDVPTYEERMDLKLESLKQTQDLSPDQIAPYYGTWKGRYLSWPNHKHVEMHFGCDGSLAITGLESQLMIFDEEYAQAMCGSSKPWEFVVHDLWGTEYFDCGYFNGLIFMQRFRSPSDDSRGELIQGYDFVATPSSRERAEMPCQEVARRELQSDYIMSAEGEANCPYGNTMITTESECRAAASALGPGTFQRATSFWQYPKGCFQTLGNYYLNTHRTGRARSNAAAVCKTGSTTEFFVNFDYEFSNWDTAGCDEYLTQSQCQSLATVERFHQFEAISQQSVPKGCFANQDGRLYYNNINGAGVSGEALAPVCGRKMAGDYLISGIPVEVHAGGTNECMEYLEPAKCMEFAEMIGDSNGLDEYYRSDWPQGCLIDFHSDTSRFMWNYVPDGGRGESDMDVAPVCQVCPNDSGCGYTPQLSDENRESNFYVYRANVVSTLTETLSQNLVEEFCNEQGLILATPRNGYEINEILKQASNLVIRSVEREDSGVGEIAYQSSGIQGETSWGNFYSLQGDQTPNIAIGLKCDRYDDCSLIRNWHWGDYTAYSGTNFDAYNKGMLTEWLTEDSLTASEQNYRWEKAQRDQFGCGYYDIDFLNNKHHTLESTYLREEVIRCREIYHQFYNQAGDLWDEFRAIENHGAVGMDQCAFIDWEADTDGRTTISTGPCDRQDYVLFACSRQNNEYFQVRKEDRRCQDRYFVLNNCQTLQNREKCLQSTEDSSHSAKNCVWCSHGPCLADSNIRCATKQFLSSQSDALNSNPQQIGITAEKSETIDSVGQYEECKIVTGTTDAADLFTSTGCQVDGTCVSSHNYPSDYGSNEQCTVQILQNVTPVVDDVDVELNYDQLFIGSVDVRSARYVPTSIAAGTEIRWTSDSSVSKKGWKICFEVESDALEETYEQEAFLVSDAAETYTSVFPFTIRVMAVVGMLAVCWAFFQFLSKETFYTNIEDEEY